MLGVTMPKKTLEQRLEEAKRKQRLLQAEVNKKNRKERTHLLVLHGVQVETALKKMGVSLDIINKLSAEDLAKLSDCYATALSAFVNEWKEKTTQVNSTSDSTDWELASNTQENITNE